MNDMARRMMDRRMRDRRMNGNFEVYGRNDRRGRDYARNDRNMPDGRRGVKGTGPYGIGGRLHYGRDRAANDYGRMDYRGGDYMRGNDYGMHDYGDYADYEDDYADYNMDYGDYADYGEMRLGKRDITEWRDKLKNADGSRGAHFDTNKVMQAAERMGIHFNNFSEKEFAITMNMLYSDYCEVLKPLVSPDKEDIVYAKMAKAFLEDDDAPEASEKLALYYHCIVCADEE